MQRAPLTPTSCDDADRTDAGSSRPQAGVRRLRRVAAVVFDCDSTLSSIEGIDELAVGRREEVEALTDAAMRGELPLEAVYGRRLELIRPSRADVTALAARYVERLVPDAAAVMAALAFEGIEARIMSGGLLPAVEAVAEALGVARHRVAAVDVAFDADGSYAGFDARSPLARAGGKQEVMQMWRREIAGPVMLVGDGATDLEASPACDLFVAYAGVAARPAVMAAADVVIRSQSLAPVFPIALGGERPRSDTGRQLFARGLELLEPEYRTFLSYSNS
jgi:phosphoserine phosphatase